MDATQSISIEPYRQIPAGNMLTIAVAFAIYVASILLLVGTEVATRSVVSAGFAVVSAGIVISVAAIARRQQDGNIWIGLGLAALLRAGASLSIALGINFNSVTGDVASFSMGLCFCGSLGFSLLLLREVAFSRCRRGFPLQALDLLVIMVISALALAAPFQVFGKAPDAADVQIGLAIGTMAGGGLALGLILISIAPAIRGIQAARWLVIGWMFLILVDWETGLELSARKLDQSQVFLVGISAFFTLALAAVFRMTVRQPVFSLSNFTAQPHATKFNLRHGQLFVGVSALAYAGVVIILETADNSGHLSLALTLATVGLIASVVRLTYAFYVQRENVENLRVREAELERQALSDSVTDLPNHRALNARLAEEVERAHRFKQPLSVCFVDVDAFKQINDTHGHQVGDEVLREIGSMLRANARQIDIVARYGGEEFVILLPGTWSDDALIFAERLREAIAVTTLRIQSDVEVRLSVSVGVAGLPEHANDRDSLIKRADAAAYVAKRSGRNQVHLYNPELTSAVGQAFSLEDAKRLVRIVEERERLSLGHGERVGNLSVLIAQRLGLDSREVERIGLSGQFHDLGKVSVPDSILGKSGQLNSRELQIVRSHPFVGARLVESSPSLVLLASALRHHHERWDGTGYPYRLAGEYIPLAARIIAISEAYDAMTTASPWREPLNQLEALNELSASAGKQFDPKLVEHFFADY